MMAFWQDCNTGQFIELKITDTEIFEKSGTRSQYCNREGDYVSVFKVDTPFRGDEIHTSHRSEMRQYLACRAEADEYIKEVKYRRYKNDRIAALEAEVKTAERELKVKPAIKESYHLLEREIEELRTHVSAIIWDKEDLQRTLLQSSETIQALKRDIDKEQSLARQLRDDNRELRCKVRKLAVQCQTRDSEILRDARLEIEELKQKIVNLESQTTVVAVPITACECSDLKAQVQSLKLQLATEKRISQKYARDLQEKDKQQSVLTAM
jgi:archaellum component FlaC